MFCIIYLKCMMLITRLLMNKKGNPKETTPKNDLPKGDWYYTGENYKITDEGYIIRHPLDWKQKQPDSPSKFPE